MSDFIPRITVPDSHDESMVAAALALYAQKCVDSVLSGDQGKISHLRRAADLLDSIYQSAVQRKANERFGAPATPEEWDAWLQKASQEDGEDGSV